MLPLAWEVQTGLFCLPLSCRGNGQVSPPWGRGGRLQEIGQQWLEQVGAKMLCDSDGLGLGLPIAFHYAHAMGSQLQVPPPSTPTNRLMTMCPRAAMRKRTSSPRGTPLSDFLVRGNGRSYLGETVTPCHCPTLSLTPFLFSSCFASSC